MVFSSTNKTDRHNITEILLKVALNTVNQTLSHAVLTFVFEHVVDETLHRFDKKLKMFSIVSKKKLNV